MMSPFKLAVIVCGSVAVLAVAPYAITVATHFPAKSDKPTPHNIAAENTTSNNDLAELPIAGADSTAAPALHGQSSVQSPVAAAPAHTAELQLPAPQVTPPSPPAPRQTLVASLPSLSNSAPVSSSTPLPTPTLTPTPTPAPTPTPLPFRNDVKEAQALMSKLGLTTGKIDGKLGPVTQAAISDFQKKYNLTPSGEPNPDTLASLNKAVAALPTPTPAPSPTPSLTPAAELAVSTPATAKIEIADAKLPSLSEKDAKDADSSIADDGSANTSSNESASSGDNSLKADNPDLVMVRKNSEAESHDSAPAELASNNAIPEPVAPKANPGPVPTLRSVKDVKKLQEKLHEANVYNDTIDGKWGHNTIEAMKTFQKNNNLEVTGKPNHETWEKMNSGPVNALNVADASTALDKNEDSASEETDSSNSPAAPQSETKTMDIVAEVTPDTGPLPGLNSQKDVKRLQERLKLAHVYSDSVDGRWGHNTIVAMKDFQKQNGLEVTGKPNSDTWKKLSQVSSSGKDVAESRSDKVAKNDKIQISDSAAKKHEPARNADSKNHDVVMKLNPDAGDPQVEAIATPATVSTRARHTPARAEENSDAAEDKPEQKLVADADELASTNNNDSDEKPAGKNNPLTKQVEAAKARIDSVSNDPRYEVDRYAPKMLESVTGIADKLKREAASNSSNPSEMKADLKRIDEGLEQAKKESLKKKATRKVADVESTYNSVKKIFPEYIHEISSTSGKSSKEQMIELMSKIDNGYDAMKADYKKGVYDRIVERCDGFIMQIEILGDEVAREYVKSQLDKKSVSSKLGDSTLSQIKQLQEKKQNMEAAEILEKAVAGKSSRKKS